MQVRLLTESCTEGWLSWGPGELWLSDDAVVRIGRTELTRRAAGMGSLGGALAAATRPIAGMTPSPSTPVTIAPEAWTAYLRQHTEIRYVPFAQIASAGLRGGLLCGALTMHLRDGTSRKLLWLRNPDVVEALRPRLPR